MPDAFGTAIRDRHRDELAAPLIQRDGADTREHPIQEYYFGQRDAESEYTRWLESRLSGPLIDLGRVRDVTRSTSRSDSRSWRSR